MLKLWPWYLTKLCTVLVVLFYRVMYIISFFNRENICQMPSELQTQSFLWEHCDLPLLHSPLELGEVDQDSFSLGWKLCQRGKFRLESVNFLLRRMFMISWFGGQSLITVDDKNILKVAWDIYQPVLIKNQRWGKVYFIQECSAFSEMHWLFCCFITFVAFCPGTESDSLSRHCYYTLIIPWQNVLSENT